MPRSCRDCLPMMPTELSAVLPARHIQEECGVFGVYAPETTDVAPLAYYALYALQHRGQESAGIAVNDDGVFTAYRDVGLVNEVFPAERLRSLGTGTIAVGHVRYGTTGSDNKRNVQPILVNHYKGRMALAHNGNLTNSHALRQELESQGSETAPAARENLISRVLRIVAMVLFIGGAVLGLAMFWMSADYAGWLNAVIQMGAIWVNAAVYGGLLLGLSEIIRLLERRP